MTWNYRVLRENHGSWGDYYKIVEAYYTGDEVTGWCDASVDGWDDYDDLKGTISKMQEAFEKPTLIKEELVNHSSQSDDE